MVFDGYIGNNVNSNVGAEAMRQMETKTRKEMKERIISNWKATIIGLIIAGMCIFLILTKHATFSECSGFFIASGLMMWVKDTIFKIKPDENGK